MKKKTIVFTVISGLFLLLALRIILPMVIPAPKGTSRLFKDQTYHFEALRVLDYANSHGAGIEEVMQTIARIEQNNDKSWFTEWYKTAAAAEKEAELHPFDPVGQGYALGRAHNYYRAAEFFMLPGDTRKKGLTAKLYSTFYKSLDLLGVEYHIMEVPYEGKSLRAVYYPAPGGKEGKEGETEKPLIIGVCGYDSIQEELYFMFVQAALKRGYPVLTYDGPGQGISIRERGMHFTHEWEKPNSAVIDTFIKTFYKPGKIVLLGNSLGGILVSRAAAFDKRIDGIINFDIFYDFARAATWEYPEQFKKRIFGTEELSPLEKAGFSFIIRTNPEVKWAMAHGSWTMGIEEPWNVLRAYRNYQVKDIADRITCDVLLMAAEKDHFVPLELLEENEKALTNARSIQSIIYTEERGGAEHCQIGAAYLWRADMFNWLESTF